VFKYDNLEVPGSMDPALCSLYEERQRLEDVKAGADSKIRRLDVQIALRTALTTTAASREEQPSKRLAPGAAEVELLPVSAPPNFADVTESHFGTRFEPRENQQDIFSAVASGMNCSAVMVPAGGKTLVIAALAHHLGRLTIVVDPFRALAFEQLESMSDLCLGQPTEGCVFISCQKKISWEFEHEGANEGHQRNTSKFESSSSSVSYADGSLSAIVIGRGSRTTIMITSPEKLVKDPDLVRACAIKRSRGQLSLLAVDESHLVVQHGTSYFRDAYMKLGEVFSLINAGAPGMEIIGPPAQIVTFSGSLPRPQEAALLGTLQMDLSRTVCLRRSVNRPEVSICVVDIGDEHGGRTKLLEAGLHRLRAEFVAAERSIVFVDTHKDAIDGAAYLSELKFVAFPFYRSDSGKLEHEIDVNRAAWAITPHAILVCTTVGSHGLHNDNVDLVVHFSWKHELSELYQAMCRVGRRRQKSKWAFLRHAALLNSAAWFSKLSAGGSERSALLTSIRAFGNSGVCRRKIILEYLGDGPQPSNCGNCDVCSRSCQLRFATVDPRDATHEIRSLLQEVGASSGGRYSATCLNGAWRSSIPGHIANSVVIYALENELLYLRRSTVQAPIKEGPAGAVEEFHSTSVIVNDERASPILTSRIGAVVPVCWPR